MPMPEHTYVKIADDLRQKIRSGEYTDRLPSRSRLCEMYAVHSGVITQATYLLRSEGIVDVIHGDGTYVAGSRDRTPLISRVHDLFHTGELAVGDVLPSESRLCDRFGVSRPTLRNTLAHLEGQGLIGRQGRGRVVLALPPDKEDE